MGNVDFVVLGLDPCKLINHLVAPLVHALIADMHLGIQYPQETEAFGCQVLDRNVYDFLVAHSRILEIEFVIGKHKT